MLLEPWSENKCSRQIGKERKKLVKWRRKQRPLQLFSHEVNKTLDQNITRNRKERVDPREFSKKQSDIGVMKIESKRHRQT